MFKLFVQVSPLKKTHTFSVLDSPQIGLPSDIVSMTPITRAAEPSSKPHGLMIMITFKVRIPATSFTETRRLAIAPVPAAPPPMFMMAFRADAMSAIPAMLQFVRVSPRSEESAIVAKASMAEGVCFKQGPAHFFNFFKIIFHMAEHESSSPSVPLSR